MGVVCEGQCGCGVRDNVGVVCEEGQCGCGMRRGNVGVV